MDEAAKSALRNAGPMPLLATKLLIPPVSPNLLPRRHLVERLDGCLAHRLTLVSAPAGFGKTTLVSAWARGLRQPVAWLALDEADNDPTRFFSYLIAALQQIDETVGRDLQALLQTPHLPDVEALVGTLINDLLAVPADFVLVLDDFHLIDGAVVHEAIRYLVAHGSPQMHLVIATREDPQLPLARLRARGQLVELRAQDLRFTPQEAAVFLKDVMGVALAPHDVDELDTRIEGWIAGLQLAGLSMQNRQNPSELIAGLSGNHHFILSYLTEEVLGRLPPDVQSFLLQTSVLSRLTGPLCDAMVGRTQSDALLESLYTSNVFVVPLDDEHRWYRYHHLFADLLRHQLNRSQPQVAPTLHGRASEWFESQGMAADAIDEAFAAGDYGRVVRLLEIHARSVVLQGYARSVESWLQRLPPEWRVAGPRANLAFGWSLLLRGQLAEVEPYLRNAEVAAAESRQAGDASSATRTLTEILALRAGLVSLQGDTAKGCEMAAEAVAAAPPDDLYLQGMVHFCLGTAYNYAGRVVPAIESYQKALPLCQAAGNSLASALAVANLALLYTIRGHLRAASDLCRQALEAAEQSGGLGLPALATICVLSGELSYQRNELAEARNLAEKWLEQIKRGGHVAAIAYGSVALSRVLQAQGDLAGARSALSPALDLLPRGMPAWVGPQVVTQQVALALAQNDAEAAWPVLAATGVRIEDAASHTREVIHLAYLRWLYHVGCQGAPQAIYLKQALDLADRLLASARPEGRMGRVLEILVLRALVYQGLGDTARANADLNEALALAEPEGYVRIFVNEGEEMRALLAGLHRSGGHAVRAGESPQPSAAATQPGLPVARHPAAGESGPSAAYLAHLLAAFPVPPVAGLATSPNQELAIGEPHPPAQPLVDPLSERELEVLHLIAGGMTYDEVAQQLVVSLNTVRFHVKSIYSKLSANNRTVAIERARSLGLL